jgi:hypothetical protein
MSQKVILPILILLCLVIIAFSVYHLTSKNSEYFAFNTVIPRVKGVSINDSMKNVLASGLESGMVNQNVLNLMKHVVPSQQTSQSEWDIQKRAIQNTLELSPTLEDARYQVASAVSNYIPAEGIPKRSSGLWVQKNTLDNLQQPGLIINPEPTTGGTGGTGGTGDIPSSLVGTPNTGKLECACK